MLAVQNHLTAASGFYEKLTEVRPLGKSSRAQLAMTVLSLHRLQLTEVAWQIFDRLSRDGLQAGGEAYSNWLFIAGDTRNHQREVDVFEQMARTAHTRGLQGACWNAVVVRCLTFKDERRAQQALKAMEAEKLCNPLSEVLRERLGLPAPGAVGEIEWRRREKDEHEWVTNSLGFSLRLNKIEYYKEVGTLHYILNHGRHQDVPKIHKAIEAFTREQELWLKLAGDEKGAVLDKVLALQGKAKLVVEVGLYVGYSSTRMASQMKQWGGRVISMEVDPYHAAIARNTIEWAGLSDYIEIWCGHSENLIPRLKEMRLPEKSIDILFFDQQGTKMHLDLQRIVDFNMLSDSAIVVGDNVLRPGAPQFMYWNSVAGPYETQVVSLREYKQEVVEDIEQSKPSPSFSPKFVFHAPGRAMLNASGEVLDDSHDTSSLDAAALQSRKLVYASVIAGTAGALVLASICVLKLRQAAQPTGRKSAKVRKSRDEGGAYELLAEGVAGGAGLGHLSQEELEDLEGEMKKLSTEERQQKLNQWAQARAEALREEHAGFLCARKVLLLLLLGLYVCASVGLPYLHRDEASCSQGLFWETHMQFLLVFGLTKLVELGLMATDQMIAWEDVRLFDLLLAFVPSFLGYLDGYTDAASVVIADSCHSPLAQQLATLMGIAYLVGVVLLQWMVMLVLSLQDPSHACLLKLLHMDALASCVTLPSEQKWVWDMLAAFRTLGEDIPQAVLQTVYLVHVKRNFFMLLSVIMAVGASLKALHDARARALAAYGADKAYEKRERDSMLYSASQDASIKCWNMKDGVCTRTIRTDSAANTIAASRGMLYSSHDHGLIHEWSLETGKAGRTFSHNGVNGAVFVTSQYLFTWACEVNGTETSYKMWSLDSAQCLKKFDGPSEEPAFMFAKGTHFFATSPGDASAVALWDVTSGELRVTFSGHSSAINGLFATSRRLFSGSSDGSVREWALDSTPTRVFGDNARRHWAPLAVVTKKLYNASATGYDINEWCLQSGELLRRFVGHKDDVESIVMLDQKLYSASVDTSIKQWSLTTAECEQTFEGHDGGVNAIILMHYDDWMSVSFWLPKSPEAQIEMAIPEAVEQLAHDTDGIRWQSVESKVSEQQWESHSQRMRREFAACGIRPFEVVPYQDAEGRSQVNLRAKQSP
ncbi:unnamed protein product [Effrenium voratum]|nr:unnamed protein product [Effrenium voratum]